MFSILYRTILTVQFYKNEVKIDMMETRTILRTLVPKLKNNKTRYLTPAAYV